MLDGHLVEPADSGIRGAKPGPAAELAADFTARSDECVISMFNIFIIDLTTRYGVYRPQARLWQRDAVLATYGGRLRRIPPDCPGGLKGLKPYQRDRRSAPPARRSVSRSVNRCRARRPQGRYPTVTTAHARRIPQ